MNADWGVRVIALSESFHTAIDRLVRELGGVPVPSSASDEAEAAAGLVLLLAGGAEAGATDLLPRLAATARVLVVGASTDHRLATAIIHGGALDYFALPEDLEALRRVLEREARALRAGLESGRFVAAEREASGFAAIIGGNHLMQQAIDQARRVTRHAGVTVLIGGETGTGKELLARAIHYEGPRAAAPFVEINCAAIPANLLESELFGHEKGSFTGATAAKPGLFEMAHGGTLFLDEIGTMPLELQAKLLRALESREIRRVGGQRTRRVDLRVIAATHADLRSAIARGEFREDLFYRLNVVSVTLPPLRERRDDIETLAEVFVRQLAASYGLPQPALTAGVRTALQSHSWPGNVRELRNAIERTLVLSTPGTLDPVILMGDEKLPVPAAGVHPLPFPADLASITRAAVHAMLAHTGGNKSDAARRLGISRPRLHRLLDDTTP